MIQNLISTILILTPAILATVIHFKIIKEEPKKLNSALIYMGYVFAINLLIITMSLLHGNGVSNFESLFISQKNLVKYSVLAVFFSVALPNILVTVINLVIKLFEGDTDDEKK